MKLINKFFMFIFICIRSSPIYPHWLEFLNSKKTLYKIIPLIYGNVIEVGAGNCSTKKLILNKNKNIINYIATDYTSWDQNFNLHLGNSKTNIIRKIFYGEFKDQSQLDKICSALDMPFEKEIFDCYLSFEVYEHLENPKKALSEAFRILKKEGKVILSIPFLYREHGGVEFDFIRFTRGGFTSLAKEIGFSKIQVLSNSFFGTTIVSLINQFLIRLILEKNKFIGFLILLIAPFIFIFNNIFGYFIDLLIKDYRFSTRYYFILQK